MIDANHMAQMVFVLHSFFKPGTVIPNSNNSSWLENAAQDKHQLSHMVNIYHGTCPPDD